MDLEPRDLEAGSKINLKRVFLYFGLLIIGFIVSAVWRGGSEAVNQTASLTAKTAGEVFAPQAQNQKTIRIPIKNKNFSAKTSASGNLLKKVSTSSSALFPPPLNVQTASSTTSSVSDFGSAAMTAAPKEPAATAAVPMMVQTVSQPAPPAAPVAQTKNGKILFYEIQISGGIGATDKDFIRIYNPNGFAVDVGKWKLKKKSKTGTESSVKVIPGGTLLPPGGTLIWANSKDDFAKSLGAQISSAETISANNSVALLDLNEKIVDAVAWGEGANQYVEGFPYPVSPEGGQILRRKTSGDSLQDTNNNAADFAAG